MPKKNKKRVKSKKKIFKKSKKVKKKKSIEKNFQKELIYKTKKEWISKGTVNKSQYEKNTKLPFQTMTLFGKKKVRELIGLNHTQKLRM